tara:strand:+ start:3497 stop:3667 length:171 start_codon:yes stop_codon:yes gene_type:complete
MDKAKLKTVVKDLKSLLTVLESEVYSDVDAYTSNTPKDALIKSTYLTLQDDDGYTD